MGGVKPKPNIAKEGEVREQQGAQEEGERLRGRVRMHEE